MSALPHPNDLIEVNWLGTDEVNIIKVLEINTHLIKYEYQDENHEREEYILENGCLPFQWRRLKSHSPKKQTQIYRKKYTNDENKEIISKVKNFPYIYFHFHPQTNNSIQTYQ